MVIANALRGVIAGTLLASVTGCSSGLELETVRGAVTLDQAPVPGAAVLFQPVAGGPVASGNTDDEGYYQLKTAGKPGVPAGRYLVAINKSVMRGLNPDGTVSAEGAHTEWIIPEIFSRPDTSGLTAVVAPGGNTLDFELTSTALPAISTVSPEVP